MLGVLRLFYYWIIYKALSFGEDADWGIARGCVFTGNPDPLTKLHWITYRYSVYIPHPSRLSDKNQDIL